MMMDFQSQIQMMIDVRPVLDLISTTADSHNLLLDEKFTGIDFSS